MTELYIQDVTLRDGMHAIRHRIDPTDVGRIVAALDAAGVDAIEVAHGDGLAGGSMNYGPGSHTDWEWLEAAADNIDNAVLTSLLLPGIGTVEELRRAYDLGVRSVRIATHCTEADVSPQHFAVARELGMETAGFLMMSHRTTPEELARQARIMVDAGCQCPYVTGERGDRTVGHDPKWSSQRPVRPSISSRTMSACPACRWVSAVRCTRIRCSVTSRFVHHGTRPGASRSSAAIRSWTSLARRLIL